MCLYGTKVFIERPAHLLIGLLYKVDDIGGFKFPQDINEALKPPLNTSDAQISYLKVLR